MSQGKWVVRIWKSGMTADLSKFWCAANQKVRSSKSEKSTVSKKDANGSQAIRRLARELNTNFTGRHGALLTLHYDAAGMERVDGDAGEADHQMMLFLGRMQTQYKKRKVTLRAVGSTSQKSSRTLEKARLHHHMVVSADLISKPEGSDEYYLAGKPLSRIWGFGTVDVQMLKAEEDHTGLAVYICRQANCAPNEKRWHSTRNLKKPEWQDVECTRDGIAEYNRHRRRGMPRLMIDHEGKLLTPPKCATCECGDYIPAIGTHYLRFLLPEILPSARTQKARRGGLRS